MPGTAIGRILVIFSYVLLLVNEWCLIFSTSIGLGLDQNSSMSNTCIMKQIKYQSKSMLDANHLQYVSNCQEADLFQLNHTCSTTKGNIVVIYMPVVVYYILIILKKKLLLLTCFYNMHSKKCEIGKFIF